MFGLKDGWMLALSWVGMINDCPKIRKNNGFETSLFHPKWPLFRFL